MCIRDRHNAKIERTVVVAGGGEETLTAVSTLLAQCSRVGGNLNQLARHFNSGVEPEGSQVCKFVQKFRPELFGVCSAGVEVSCELVPVSYTHLDVYKRQELQPAVRTGTLFLSFAPPRGLASLIHI